MTISSLVTIAALAWTSAKADYAWRFPDDHWAHPGYKTEWWYFTGHTGRFAYQFTMFKVGLSETPVTGSTWSTEALVMGHVAVTDLESGEHRFAEVIQRVQPELAGYGAYPESRIIWCRGPAGTAESWELAWKEDGFVFHARDSRQAFAMELATHEAKPLVFQGANGLSRKGRGEEAASLYYSQTRLATRGTIELDGKRYEVTGESWMDKEFGSNLLGEGQVGWDWFSLQLDDQRELMLYVLRRADGGVDWASGTLVDRDGKATYLGRDDFSVTASGSWESKASRARYPTHWTVVVPAHGLALDIDAKAKAQENVSKALPKLFYWEGAVEVRGSASGRGFVELTGYGTSLKPAL
ncbi:MAG TPA: lipocalin-like domain-containing protein [Myxococcota bacterium]|nr:lipocalin-like domain-containing protein [Myxococcota bacterium]